MKSKNMFFLKIIFVFVWENEESIHTLRDGSVQEVHESPNSNLLGSCLSVTSHCSFANDFFPNSVSRFTPSPFSALAPRLLDQPAVPV